MKFFVDLRKQCFFGLLLAGMITVTSFQLGRAAEVGVVNEEKVQEELPRAGFPVDNLKGTLTCLPKELKDASILYGAVAWEKGMLQNMYDHAGWDIGVPEPVYPIRVQNESNDDFEQRKIEYKKTYKDWLAHVSPETWLVRTLFHRVPGTTSAADFKVSQLIGENGFSEDVANFIATLNKDALDQEKIKDFVTKLIPIKSQWLHKEAVNNINILIEKSPEKLRLMLLGMVWAKCGNDREALDAYYNKVLGSFLDEQKHKPTLTEEQKKANSAIGEAIKQIKNNSALKPDEKKKEVQDLQKDIVKASLTEEQRKENEEIQRRINRLKGQTFSGQGDEIVKEVKDYTKYEDVTDPEKLEKFVYEKLLPSDRPNNIGYKKATYNGEPIADCMETTIRNFINHLCYDPQTHIFSVEKLRKLGCKPSNELVAFLKGTSPDQGSAEKPTAHNDWFAMMSNIENVKDTKGYSRSGDHELKPSYKNLIFVLDHILGLNLFENNNKEAVNKMIKENRFVQTYLPEMFGKLKVDLKVPLPSEIDKKDSQEGELRLDIELKGTLKPYSVSFIINHNKHGQFESEKAVEQDNNVFQNLSQDQWKKLSLPMTALISQNQLERFIQANHGDSERIYQALVVRPLEPDRIKYIAKSIPTFNKKLLNLCLACADKHADERMGEEARGLIYGAAFEGGLKEDKKVNEELFADREKTIQMAVKEGYVSLVKEMLKQGVKVNTRGRDSYPLLHLASTNGHTEVVRLFLNKGADVDARDRDGCTPLYLASALGHTEVVKLLLRKDADVDAVGERGGSLHIASRTGHTEVVKLLLDKGADVVARDNHGRTPLHYTVLNDNTEAAKLLLGNGADVDARDNDGRTPLVMATNRGNRDLVKLLIDKGAYVNPIEKFEGKTILHHAVIKGFTAEMVDFLLEKSGGHVIAVDDKDRTPLHYAAERGQVDTVKKLIDRYADVDARDNDGRTPLYFASITGHTEIVKLLIDKGAGNNDEERKALINEARLYGKTAVVELLRKEATGIQEKKDYKLALQDKLTKENIKRNEWEIELEKKQKTQNDKRESQLQAQADRRKSYLTNKAAVKIQSIFRGFSAKKNFIKGREERLKEQQEEQEKKKAADKAEQERRVAEEKAKKEADQKKLRQAKLEADKAEKKRSELVRKSTAMAKARAWMNKNPRYAKGIGIAAALTAVGSAVGIAARAGAFDKGGTDNSQPSEPFDPNAPYHDPNFNPGKN